MPSSLKGVHIGDQSVIGAGAVVTQNEIQTDSLVISNPSQVRARQSLSTMKQGGTGVCLPSKQLECSIKLHIIYEMKSPMESLL